MLQPDVMKAAKESCRQLLNIYNRTIQSFVGYPFLANEYDSWHGLCFRLLAHGLSALSLTEGTKVSEVDFENNFLDGTSILVLSRAMLETYGVLYYLFLDPQSVGDERTFRFYYQSYRGLIIRQKPTIPEYAAVRATDKARMDADLLILQGTAKFLGLSESQKKQVLNGKYEPIPKKIMIANAGFSSKTVETEYALLSDYAHAGYISLIQSSQVDTVQQQMENAVHGLLSVTITLGLAINHITKHFHDLNFQHSSTDTELFESLTQFAGDDTIYYPQT